MGDRKRILVIDDNRALASAAEGLLQRQDYDVVTALDGAEGFHKAKEGEPDVIILDAIISGVGGCEVVRRLRQDPGTSGIPVIFLGAEGRTNLEESPSATGLQDIRIAFECGASDFLQKPVTAADLVRSVKNALWFSRISAPVLCPAGGEN